MSTPLRHCGLDFGTSNTTLGVAGEAGARLVPLEDGKLTIPSTLFFDFFTSAPFNEKKRRQEKTLPESSRSLVHSQ